MTPEDPQGEKLTREENDILISKFKKYLNQLNIIYIEIKGKFISRERSFMLYNISLSDAEFLNTEFNQLSFIFGTSSLEKGIDVSYYEWNGKSYIEKYKVNNVTDAKDFEDFYSKHGEFKWSFPFPFEEAWDSIDEAYLDKCCDESLTPKWRANYRAHFYKKGHIY